MYKFAAIAIAVVSGIAYYQSGFGTSISAAPQSVTLQEIQTKAEFTAISAPAQVIIPAESTDKVFGLEQKNKLLLVASVNVTAGVDLSKAKLTGNLLELPPPQILSAYVDVTKNKLYDHQQSLFAPNRAAELQQAAQNNARIEGVKATCENGILDRANAQAVAFFSGWLKPYEISVKSSPPGDCTPPP